MSYDIKLQNSCDHKINWMRYGLENDLRTVLLSYPVASSASFKLRINFVEQREDAYAVKNVARLDTQRPEAFLVMRDRVKHNAPILEVSYYTFSEFCPKCSGTKYVDDLEYIGPGEVRIASEETLLLQRFEKIIVTKLSSNVFHDWYGTGLHSLIGMKISDKDMMRSKIIDQIGAAVDRIRKIQKDMVATGRTMSPGELLGKLEDIIVEETDDPTLIQVTVSFRSQRGTPMEYSQYISTSNLRQRVAY